MGWGRMLLLGNFGQQMDIEDQRREIARIREEIREARDSGEARVAGDARADVEALEREVDELRLYVAVLVRLVVARGVVAETEFRALVEAVDAEDGRPDGRHEGFVG